jgi:hypothetical protein
MSVRLNAHGNTSVESKYIFPSMDLTIFLSTDVKTCHDYNAFQLPNSTAQTEIIDMSTYHESCISMHTPPAPGFGGVRGQVIVLRCLQGL